MNARGRGAAHVALALVAALAGAVALDRLRGSLHPDQVRWLVSPAVGLVELAGGGPFEWEPGEGFLARAARLRVTGDCAGARFLLVATALLGLAWVRGSPRRRLRAALLAATAAFAVTTLANAARIGFALRLAAGGTPEGWSFEAAHRASSLAIYGVAFVLVVALGRGGRSVGSVSGGLGAR